MTKEFNTKISQGDGDEQQRPGGRLAFSSTASAMSWSFAGT
jgi:hypothetical protein